MLDGWMLDGWMVGESGIKANSAQFSWSLAELGNSLFRIVLTFVFDDDVLDTGTLLNLSVPGVNLSCLQPTGVL